MSIALPSKPDWQRAITSLSLVTTIFLIAFLLYWARTIFIPLALAVFIAFVLSPAVSLLQRARLGRTLSVLLTVALAIAITSLVLWIVTHEMNGLTRTLPDPVNAERIRKKIEFIRENLTIRRDDRFGRLINELQNTISSGSDLTSSRLDADTKSVVIEPRSPSWVSKLESYVSPAMEIIGQIAFSFILVIFMLLRREDLRNRMIRLIGNGRVTTVTKALDDASRRISRYLLMQLALNCGFGVLVAIGLIFLGVKYAVLWGFIATLMRYIPYIGTMIGVVPPFLFSFAMSEGWAQPLSILVLYFGLEAINNNALEPWLYGKRLGVSQVAQLVSAAFWSFLWGPVGLVLSSPLTTCLLVLGKYVPQAKFLDVLLGDEPALDPDVAFYQRLAARDQDEAAEIVLKEAKSNPLPILFDRVIVPAISAARRDTLQGEYSERELDTMLDLTCEIVADVEEASNKASEEEDYPADRSPIPILICPARDRVDQVGAQMLTRLLDEHHWEAEVTDDATLTSELLERIDEKKPAAVGVVSIPPDGLSHTCYVCKRIRRRFPEIRILVCHWGLPDEEKAGLGRILQSGADNVSTSLEGMLRDLHGWHSPLAAAIA